MSREDLDYWGPTTRTNDGGAAARRPSASWARLSSVVLTKVRPMLVDAPQVLAYRLALQCPRRPVHHSGADHDPRTEPDSATNMFGDIWPQASMAHDDAVAQSDDDDQACVVLGVGRFATRPPSAHANSSALDPPPHRRALGRVYVVDFTKRHRHDLESVALEG